MKPADVCLIVEGGYPYVLGGVAFWVDALIRSLPQFRFHIVAIRISTQKPELRFELPSDVVGVQDIVLDGHSLARVRGDRAKPLCQASSPAFAPFYRAENEFCCRRCSVRSWTIIWAAKPFLTCARPGARWKPITRPFSKTCRCWIFSGPGAFYCAASSISQWRLCRMRGSIIPFRPVMPAFLASAPKSRPIARCC